MDAPSAVKVQFFLLRLTPIRYGSIFSGSSLNLRVADYRFASSVSFVPSASETFFGARSLRAVGP